MHCPFFDLSLILITPMVSSNFSYRKYDFCLKLKICIILDPSHVTKHTYTSIIITQSNINISVLCISCISYGAVVAVIVL